MYSFFDPLKFNSEIISDVPFGYPTTVSPTVPPTTVPPTTVPPTTVPPTTVPPTTVPPTTVPPTTVPPTTAPPTTAPPTTVPPTTVPPTTVPPTTVPPTTVPPTTVPPTTVPPTTVPPTTVPPTTWPPVSTTTVYPTTTPPCPYFDCTGNPNHPTAKCQAMDEAGNIIQGRFDCTICDCVFDCNYYECTQNPSDDYAPTCLQYNPKTKTLETVPFDCYLCKCPDSVFPPGPYPPGLPTVPPDDCTDKRQYYITTKQNQAGWKGTDFTAFYIVSYLQALGWSYAGAIGAVANLRMESPTFNPSQRQFGGGPGRGIAQWEVGGRFDTDRTNLVDFAKNRGKKWDDLEIQIEFIHFEHTKGSKKFRDAYDYYNGLNSGDLCADSVEATKKFFTDYEKAKDPTGTKSSGRQDFAREYCEKFLEFKDLVCDVSKNRPTKINNKWP